MKEFIKPKCQVLDFEDEDVISCSLNENESQGDSGEQDAENDLLG